MGRPITTTVTLTAGVANGIALAQALVGAGPIPLALNGAAVVGGVATFATPRRVIITSSGNDTGITFTFSGAARPEVGGQPITEVVAGTNAGISQTTQDFGTITGITASGPTAGNITAGTNGVASGPWVPWDQNLPDFLVSVAGFVMSGAPTWQVEYTYDDVFGTWLPAGVTVPRALVHATLKAQAGTADGNFNFPIRASRIAISAGSGSVQCVQTQAGSAI